MPDISKIKLPSGTTYDIKDAAAREAIEELQGYTEYLGVTTTALTDGATTNPITIGGKSVTAKKGSIANYGSKEFIFNGTEWQEFGDMSGLGALAYKDSASGAFKPAGTVTKPTFTGTASTVTVTATANTSGNYQPTGTVSQPTFSGSEMTATGKVTPEGSVTVSTNATENKTAAVSAANSGTATYTPGGTVTQPTFTGTAASIEASGKFTPQGSVALTKTNKTTTVSKTSGTATYTPEGTVSTPTITVTPNTTTVNSITDVGTLPELTTTVENEVLTIGFNKGTLPTKGGNTTVATGIKSATASQPTFTGTGARLVTGNISTADSASFTGTEGDVSATASYTPGGSVSQPTFSGTAVRLVTGNIPVPKSYTATFTGTEGDVSVKGTPAGTVSQPTFTGSKVQLSGSVTPGGSVSQPTFEGTSGTVTVS